MPIEIPTAYTMDELAAFMLAESEDMAGILHWTLDANSFDRAVVAAVRLYGVATIDEATDMGKLEAVARLTLWQAVVRALASFYDWTDPGGSNSQSQLQKNALAALKIAAREAAHYGVSSYSVTSSQVIREDDPYRVAATATEFGT